LEVVLTFLISILLIAAVLPILWQIPRTFWPVHLNSDGTAFTGLYRRYSVGSATGYASNIRTWDKSRTIGSVSSQTTGIFVPGGFSASTTIRDTRRKFTAYHLGFVLADRNGTKREFDAANVGASVKEGDLVSAAWLIHNGKTGNAFLVYDHTTNIWWVESSSTGVDTAHRGVVKMILKLPTAYLVILCLGIVTIPFVFLIGLGAQLHLRGLQKRGVFPLVAALKIRAAEFPALRLESAKESGTKGASDLVSQVKEITALHESGALSVEEFQAAKSKLLGT
jgi:hypothetical protein